MTHEEKKIEILNVVLHSASIIASNMKAISDIPKRKLFRMHTRFDRINNRKRKNQARVSIALCALQTVSCAAQVTIIKSQRVPKSLTPGSA